MVYFKQSDENELKELIDYHRKELLLLREQAALLFSRGEALCSEEMLAVSTALDKHWIRLVELDRQYEEHILNS